MPPQQSTRDLIAYHKQAPNPHMILNQSIVLVDDSIRRGTQLRKFVQDKIEPYKPKEVHARIASPPQLFAFYLDKTTNNSDLIARQAIVKIEGDTTPKDLSDYQDVASEKYRMMISIINESNTNDFKIHINR
ncbi:MAG: amidophosphoribosyltransferase [Thermoproteota archaeon]|nr:amidophosphoribosyltransferase [Thermoproteota archaeon]